MNIVVIGDIHGKKVWKKAAMFANPDDIVVFVGDYLDSFDESPETQVQNFKEILEYKKVKKDNCILLLGNHDFQYSKRVGDYERYSGYNPRTKELIGTLIDDAIENGLIQLAYFHKFKGAQNGILFTHAGVTKTWLKRAGLEQLVPSLVETAINDLFKKTVEPFRFAVGSDPYGDDPVHSPLWVRPESLTEDRIEDMSQVVGHTKRSLITSHYVYPYIFFVDVLDYSDEFLILSSSGSKIIKL